MPLQSLHPNQQRIVKALQSGVRILHMTDHITIVGGLGRFLAGTDKWVGDIDVLIDEQLCKRYWDFLEVLDLHGITSVYDVLDRPKYPWKPCRQTIAHAKALTVDCCANVLMSCGMKHANLDICFTASDLNAIPQSSRWVRELNPDELRKLDETARTKRINDNHSEFLKELQGAERTVTNRKLHDGIGLYFAC